MFWLWKWYFNWKKNDFEKMCDEIAECEKRQKCKFNPMICAQAYVKKYVGENETRELQLKAEANNIKHSDFMVNVVTITGVGVTIFSAIVSTIKDAKSDLAVFILVSIFILMINMLVSIIKFKNIGTWQKYILIAIEEIEKERQKNADHK
nr:MAG TPA: hypothetical protein [Caudoviricetes sp.]